jgi:aspartate oxidase
MERYAPTLKDLAPRDFVSRSMDQEIKEGRGCGEHGDHVLLKLDHLGAETILKRLPSIREIAIKFANVDPIKDPIPVVPTIHYQMGGIPTNYHGEVVVPKGGNPNTVVPGLYAIGECACVSVHGANRLGTNSLLDLLVFGRAAGNHIVTNKLSADEFRDLPPDAGDASLARLAHLEGSSTGENIQDVANDVRKTMQAHCGVFRTEELLKEGVDKIAELDRKCLIRHGSRPSNLTILWRLRKQPWCLRRLARRVVERMRIAITRTEMIPTGCVTAFGIAKVTGSITSPWCLNPSALKPSCPKPEPSKSAGCFPTCTSYRIGSRQSRSHDEQDRSFFYISLRS